MKKSDKDSGRISLYSHRGSLEKSNRRTLGAMECAAIAKIATNTTLQYARMASTAQQYKSWDDIPVGYLRFLSAYVHQLSDKFEGKALPFTYDADPKSKQSCVGSFLAGVYSHTDEDREFRGMEPLSAQRRQEVKREYKKTGASRLNEVFHSVAETLIEMEEEGFDP